MSDQDKLQEIRENISRDYYAIEDQRDAANEDVRFCDVDGAMYEDWLDRQFAYRPKMEFNKVAQAVYRFIGEWRANKVETKFVPDDAQTSEDDAELISGLQRKDYRRSGGEQSVDQAAQEMAKSGFGAFRVSTEHVDEEDPETDSQRFIYEPIYTAYNSVIFDSNAKAQDKSDAKHATVLTQMTREAAEAEYGDKVSSAFEPNDQSRFNWNTQTHVWIGEYYEIRTEKTEAIIFRTPLGKKRTVYAEDFKDLMEELADGGYEEIKRRKIKRKSIWKAIISGEEYLEEFARIAGKMIPIVPIYGYRSFVDGEEHFYGIVRKQKDANRLFNMAASSMAENAATTQKDIPIFTEDQVEGRENDLAQMHLAKFNYAVINPAEDAEGNVIATGPIGTWGAPRVDPNHAAIMQISAEYIREETGGAPQDVMDPSASGKAINAVQQRVDMQTFILMDNISLALRRAGQIYRSIAAEVYAEERAIGLLKEDDTELQTRLFDIVVDSKTGKPKAINDVTKGVFEVVVSTGPGYASRKRETLDTLMGLANTPIIANDQELANALAVDIVDSVDGVGLTSLKEVVKRRQLMSGLRDPETEEEFAMVQQAQEQGNQPDALMIAAQAEQTKAEAEQISAQTKVMGAQTNQFKAETDRFKAMQDAQATGFKIENTKADTQGKRIDNASKIADSFSKRIGAGQAFNQGF